MIYKFYKFTEPEIVLMIATTPEEAVREYQQEVASSVEDVSFEEIRQTNFLVQLVQMTTDDLPTIEYDLKNAILDTQESMFCLKKSGKEAIIVFKKC